MRKRVSRTWLWVVILAIVIVFTCLISGCSQIHKTEEQRHEDFIRSRETYYAEYFIEIDYKGHTYIYYRRFDYMGLTHAGHCEGSH